MDSILKRKVVGVTAAILVLSLSYQATAENDVDLEIRKAEIKAQFDADGDGRLNGAERQFLREVRKALTRERLANKQDKRDRLEGRVVRKTSFERREAARIRREAAVKGNSQHQHSNEVAEDLAANYW